MTTFVFVDRWWVAAEPAAVSALVHDVEQWPRWWPSARSVERVPVEAGRGTVWRFTFRTRLPYAIVFEAEMLHDDPPTNVDARVTGRLDGHGSWTVWPVEGGTEARFDYSVRPTLPWMRLLSPVAKPLFAWNHKSLMTEGGEACARELGRPLLRPVVSEVHVRRGA